MKEKIRIIFQRILWNNKKRAMYKKRNRIKNEKMKKII
jgi:hypothetical protein